VSAEEKMKKDAAEAVDKAKDAAEGAEDALKEEGEKIKKEPAKSG
jgi:predicted RNase H-like HicB family nuclease